MRGGVRRCEECVRRCGEVRGDVRTCEKVQDMNWTGFRKVDQFSSFRNLLTYGTRKETH